MPIILYEHTSSGPCRAVNMAAQYVGVDLDKKYVDLKANDTMKPEFLQINPQHCVPTIDDGGFYLWESRAILTYLVNKYAPESSLYPQDPQARAIVDRMLYFDIGTLHKAEAEFFYPQIMRGEPADPEKEKGFTNALTLLEEFLTKTSYVAGNHITVADFSILGTLTFTELFDYSYEKFPKICAYLQKLKSEIPNYKEINQDPLDRAKERMKSRKVGE